MRNTYQQRAKHPLTRSDGTNPINKWDDEVRKTKDVDDNPQMIDIRGWCKVPRIMESCQTNGRSQKIEGMYESQAAAYSKYASTTMKLWK